MLGFSRRKDLPTARHAPPFAAPELPGAHLPRRAKLASLRGQPRPTVAACAPTALQSIFLFPFHSLSALAARELAARARVKSRFVAPGSGP